MMMAPETQDPPVTDDELAQRRAAQGGLKDFDPGQTIEDIANGSLTVEEDGQVAFVWEHGRKVTFGSLIERGTAIEYRVRFGGMSIKGAGEPIPLEAKNVMLLGTFVVGGYAVDAVRDDEDNVEKVKVYVKLKPKSYVDAHSEAARAALVGEGSAIVRLVAQARAEGLDDAAIREIVDNELSEALAFS